MVPRGIHVSGNERSRATRPLPSRAVFGRRVDVVGKSLSHPCRSPCLHPGPGYRHRPRKSLPVSRRRRVTPTRRVADEGFTVPSLDPSHRTSLSHTDPRGSETRSSPSLPKEWPPGHPGTPGLRGPAGTSGTFVCSTVLGRVGGPRLVYPPTPPLQRYPY